MEIGKRIYYEKSTGNVILDKGEMQGSVIETTQPEDFAIFPGLLGKDPSSIDFLQLSYGERADEFDNMGSMRVDPQTRELIIYPRLTISTDKTQIQANGTDTAIITSDQAENFSVDGGQEYAVNPFQFASTIPGVYAITAKSTLYGQNSLTVEVV